MPTCRNCGTQTSFVVSLTITAEYTDGAYGPPHLYTDVQCGRCDSTHVDGDPYELIELDR